MKYITFCPICSKEIINNQLYRFWKNCCIDYILENEMPEYQYDDRIAMQYIEALEKKNLIISLDYATQVKVRPQHINTLQEDDATYYNICMKPEHHVAEVAE